MFSHRPVIAGTALCALLTAATSASAECAWVLWSYHLTPTQDLHLVQTAHTSKAECEKTAVGYGSVLRNKGFTVAESPREVIGSKDATSIRYYCLPDTVDPRGPKGGK